ncbi:MAG: nucleotidyltransferase domain-containing protein [Nanoarchaeota archaeon]
MVKKKNINQILKEQVSKIIPSQEELITLQAKTKEITRVLEENLKKKKIKADVFVGGSFAKDTLIKKNKYDVDIFVRFVDNLDDSKISTLMNKIIARDAVRLHGSRDYFVIHSALADFEIIPVLKIKNPGEAKNITDLSYFHVSYVKNKIKKNPKLANEIRLAKAFAHSQDCYGAESYINGFSGYGVELLMISYGSFIKFIEAVVKNDAGKQKIILDPEKLFKNKEAIMQQMNESKLLSPIVLIDPTFKERNALAALSMATFEKFKTACSRFLKNPSVQFFITKNKEAEFSKKYDKNMITLEFSTEKQAGDIAGTKLKKFSGFFLREASRYFNIKASEFIYDEPKNAGRFLLVAEQKKEIIFPGPPIEMKDRVREFKKEHKNIKIIKGKAFAYEKSVGFEVFLNNFENEKSGVITSMDVEEIKRL